MLGCASADFQQVPTSCRHAAHHQRAVQAGQIQGRILHSMGAAVRSNGLGALYSGHTAFLMQGLPYDVTELVTYSQLRAAKGPLRQMPTEMRDMLIGEP